MLREPTVTRRNPGLKATFWNKRKKINIQPEQNEETTIKKSEESLTNLWDNLKCSNTPFIGGARRRRTAARNWKPI